MSPVLTLLESEFKEPQFQVDVRVWYIQQQISILLEMRNYFRFAMQFGHNDIIDHRYTDIFC